MQYNDHFDKAQAAALAEAVIQIAENAFGGHVNHNIMKAYHNAAKEVVLQHAKKGTDLDALFERAMNERGGKEFKGLCPQGYDYFQQSLKHAFGIVSAQSPDQGKIKLLAKQVADVATINVAQSTGAFDAVLKPKAVA